ncbi:hypothetical protein TNCV_4076711 [Trichonephila clavipes]|nr:hypothetical protein TNCV_4076711 [Trichonephila clavipes]
MCTNVSFVNSSTAAAPWIAYYGVFLQDLPLRQTINGFIGNGLMSTEPGKLIGSMLSFQLNHASVCENWMAALVLDDMSVNATFQSALSSDIVT